MPLTSSMQMTHLDQFMFGQSHSRRVRSWSQEALAARAALHSDISILERGVRMPSILVAQQVAATLEPRWDRCSA